MAKGLITDIVSISSKIKHDSINWAGYNPELIDNLEKSVETLEDRLESQQHAIMMYKIEWLKTMIAAGIVTAILGLFVTLWVAMGTSWRDATKAVTNEVRKELKADEKEYRKLIDKEYRTILENQEFNKLGFKKEMIMGSEVWVKR